MKTFSNKEWLRTDEGKKVFDEIRQRLTSMLEQTRNFRENILPKAKTICKEMAPTIAKDYGVNPDEDEFMDFLLDEIDFRMTAKMGGDELLRAYGEWRKSQHYNHLKWRPLYDELINANYITTTIEVFNEVMTYKRLPGGADQILWLTQKNRAMYFQAELNFTVPQLKECFRNKDGTPFVEHNRTRLKPKDPIKLIIKNFVDTLRA